MRLVFLVGCYVAALKSRQTPQGVCRFLFLTSSLFTFPCIARDGCCPSPGLACRLGRWSPVATVQRRPKRELRPVRSRAPPALAHPLPRSYSKGIFYLAGAGGGLLFYNLNSKGGPGGPPLLTSHKFYFSTSEVGNQNKHSTEKAKLGSPYGRAGSA